jgi:hypothetical protein
MRELLEVVSMIVGLATLGLIITRSTNTAQVINAGGNAFSQLLATATFQNSGSAGQIGSIY